MAKRARAKRSSTKKRSTKKKGRAPIKIKKSKVGTFTAAAKKRGMSVQAFASLVIKNPGRYSEEMRKKAQFAKNAKKFN